MTSMNSPSWGKRLTLVAMCLGLFLAQTDTTAVNLALPALGRDLHGDLADLQWVVDAYNLSFAALLLTGGTAGDRWGRRRLFIVGIAGFVLGSLVCAVAGSLAVLIAGRVLQGVGAALAIPQSLAILAVAFPRPAERNRAMAAWSAVTGIALAAGPTLGGLLVERVGWQSIFWINLPIGVAALALAVAAVPESRDPQARPIDPAGQVLAAGFLATLTFTIVEISRDAATGAVALAAGACVVFLAAFVVIERRSSSPMLPLGLLRRGPLPVAAAVAACMTFGMYGWLMLISLDQQQERGVGALLAGVLLLPLPIVITLGSPLTGRLVTRFGPRPAMTAGMAIMGVGLLVFAILGGDAPLPALEVIFAGLGLGLALNTGPVVGVAVAAVSADRTGLASGIANLARMFGATLGVALLGTVLSVAGHGASHGPDFLHGLSTALLVGAAVELIGAVVAYFGVPVHRAARSSESASRAEHARV
jgi:DHA2 family methylenomycin A resistance protein-like MFS transporter